MTIVNPNCPKCGATLEYDERLNEEFDIVCRGSEEFVKEICRGHCPKCNKRYIWNALYSFARNEELESEEDEE